MAIPYGLAHLLYRRGHRCLLHSNGRLGAHACVSLFRKRGIKGDFGSCLATRDVQRSTQGAGIPCHIHGWPVEGALLRMSIFSGIRRKAPAMKKTPHPIKSAE